MKKTVIAPKTEGKLRIEGVGTFVPERLKGTKKSDLFDEHFSHLPADVAAQHHETLWKAVSKGEMPQEPQTEETDQSLTS